MLGVKIGNFELIQSYQICLSTCSKFHFSAFEVWFVHVWSIISSCISLFDLSLLYVLKFISTCLEINFYLFEISFPHFCVFSAYFKFHLYMFEVSFVSFLRIWFFINIFRYLKNQFHVFKVSSLHFDCLLEI